MRISDWSSDVCSSDLESLDPGAEPALRDQSEDGAEVAPAQLRRGRPDGTQAAALDGAVTGGGSADLCLPQAHTAAAGRVPLCAAGHDRADASRVAADRVSTCESRLSSSHSKTTQIPPILRRLQD